MDFDLLVRVEVGLEFVLERRNLFISFVKRDLVPQILDEEDRLSGEGSVFSLQCTECARFIVGVLKGSSTERFHRLVFAVKVHPAVVIGNHAAGIIGWGGSRILGNGHRCTRHSVREADVREEDKQCLLEEEPGPVAGSGFGKGAFLFTEHPMG